MMLGDMKKPTVYYYGYSSKWMIFYNLNQSKINFKDYSLYDLFLKLNLYKKIYK